VTCFNNGGVCGLRVQYFTKIQVKNMSCGLVAGGEFLKCWWRGVVILRQKQVKSAGYWRGHASSQQVPLNQGGLVLVAGAGV